ncbi:MAG: tRNA dihydrouridine synthase [Planctomycetota bacterium]
MSPETAPRRTRRSVGQIAREVTVDPRIGQLVPGFDAPFFQAGLAGYSDGAMRLVARRHGCPYCVTEALLDRTLINGGKGRAREDPDLLKEECGTGDPAENRAAGLDDHPIAGQIMGTHPDEMARGASILVDMGHDVIDVNLACPVKKVRRRNRGGHFLSAPEDAIGLLRAVREAVPTDRLTTVKLRRAYDEGPEMAANFERVFDASYELGYTWTTVHCRTVQQRYVGPGRWEFLSALTRRYPDRIIFGSGDVWTVDDIFAMLEVTGVQGVSVARGAIGNPWIFRQARQLMAGQPATAPTLPEQREVLLEHFRLSAALHGERPASRMMRKFGIKFSGHHPDPTAVKNDFVKCRSAEDWRQVILHHYHGDEADGTRDHEEQTPDSHR